MQSHAHRKHVVASGLLHRLHDRAGAARPRPDATEPADVPGGGPARVEDMVLHPCYLFEGGSNNVVASLLTQFDDPRRPDPLPNFEMRRTDIGPEQ